MDIEGEEGIRSVVLRRGEGGNGLGFSIMGGAGYEFPPVIYGIENDSPAAISGMLETGDVILSINEREVVKLSTKEVLKCLRLSGDIVHIKYRRDPHIVSRLRPFLTPDGKRSGIPVRSPSHTHHTTTTTNPNLEPPDQVDFINKQNKPSFTDELFINHTFNLEKGGKRNGSNNANGGKRKNFETFVMTGEAILNVSRNSGVDLISPCKPNKPMPHLPIYVERDKDYNRRMRLQEKERSESKEEDTSAAPLPSPPLPPQPEQVEMESSVKSELLPPPPPPNDTIEINGGFDNNNEDTSISSSVMSSDPDSEEMKEPVAQQEERKGEDKSDVQRERYNEYILFNGSRDEDSSHHSQSPKAEEPDESEADESISEPRYPPPLTLSSSSHQKSEQNQNNDSDSSDVESMRLAPVTKAVDLPSAERLAKRLYQLDGFKSTDVWRHLSKPTDFNRIVATEYLNFFTFINEGLDVSLRKFLSVCPLRGETQDRERVLSYFSVRWVECNPDCFGSQDSVHTLACALMLLNTDIYSGISGMRQKMNCAEFIENLSGLNDGGDFPRDVLKKLYLSIRAAPLVSPECGDDGDSNKEVLLPIDPPVSTTEFKRGYLVRKCTNEFGGKKTPFGKRGWKMHFFCLKELLLELYQDEGMKGVPVSLKLHHSLATIASDYRKRKNVFRLCLADRSEALYQSSETREMHSWVDVLNWNAARFSAPALDAPCSSSGKFQHPLLPSSITRLSRRDQIASHQAAVANWEKEMDLLAQPKKKSSTIKKEDKEKLYFYQNEIKRYRAYLEVLEKRGNMLENEDGDSSVHQSPHHPQPPPPSLLEESS